MDIKKEPEDGYFEIEIPPLYTPFNEVYMKNSLDETVHDSVDENVYGHIAIKSEVVIETEIIQNSSQHELKGIIGTTKKDCFELDQRSNIGNSPQCTAIKEGIVLSVNNNVRTHKGNCESNIGFPQFYNGEIFARLFDLHKVACIKLHRINFFPHNFVCSECNLIFRSSTLLTEHKIQSRHTFYIIDKKKNGLLPDEKLFACDLCSFKCKARNSLKRHQFTHSNIKPFKCDVCDSNFRQACHLKSHKLTHSNIYPYKCEICGVGFKNPSNLKRHIMSHINERAYKCFKCPAAFIQLDHLKVHEMIHNNVAPFSCELCNMRFRRKINLRRHMKVHTKQPNHQIVKKEN